MQWNQRTCHDCKRHLSRPGAKTRGKSQGKGRAWQNWSGNGDRAVRSERQAGVQLPERSMGRWNRSKRALKARLKPMTLEGQLARGNHFGFSRGYLTRWKSVKQLTLSVTVDKRTNLFRKTVTQRPNKTLSHPWTSCGLNARRHWPQSSPPEPLILS